MRNKEVLLTILMVILISISFVSANIHTENDSNVSLDDLEEEFGDVELVDAGITPDSVFYFIEDYILSRFRDDLENKEKKIAEIEEMIKEGKIKEARKALQRYRKFASDLEKEIDPENRDRAKRSAAAIRKVLKELEKEISEEDREEFIEDVIEHEEAIITAAEIAHKIKALCEELSKLDPIRYAKTCKTDKDDPKWHRDLDEELTKEQKKEAREFFEIMSECFEDPRECRCDDISIKPFAEKCKLFAPLAAACDLEDDEDACDELDRLEDEEDPFDLLPEYLQDVLDEVEDRYRESEFEHHLPRECREEGATTREACMRVMFRIHAPEECIEALERGEISLDSEREAREKCEEIMFEANAPEECIEAGLRDFRECEDLMFELDAPQECKEAGITNFRDCEEFMEENGFDDHRGPGPGFDIDCRRIEDPEKRLDCYDRISEEIIDRERENPSDNWPPECQEAEAFTRESCEQVFRDLEEERRDFDDHEDDFDEPEDRDDFEDEGDFEEEHDSGDSPPLTGGVVGEEEENDDEIGEESGSEDDSGREEDSSDNSGSGSDNSGSDSDDSGSGSDSSDSAITGSVIGGESENALYSFLKRIFGF